jgi:hypothetical protein
MRRQMEMLGRDPNGHGQQQQRGGGQQQGDQAGQGREGDRNQKGQSQGKGGSKGQQGQQGQGGGERAGESGQGQGGQQGQSQSSQQGGQQSQGDAQGGGGGQFGGPREARQGGSRGDADYSAMNRGGYLPEFGGRMPQPGSGPSGLAGLEGAYREGMRDLNRMRQELGGSENADVARDVQALLREMQQLDPARFKGNPELVEQLRTQLLANLEQMELQIRRKLDDRNTGQVRSTPARPVPQGYQESVADYFRRLSRGK